MLDYAVAGWNHITAPLKVGRETHKPQFKKSCFKASAAFAV